MEDFYRGLALMLLYALVGLLTFIVYGLDKGLAQRGGRRTPEWLLLTIAALGGSTGALLGMVVWHHKTAHAKFRYLVPLFWLLHSWLFFAYLVD